LDLLQRIINIREWTILKKEKIETRYLKLFDLLLERKNHIAVIELAAVRHSLQGEPFTLY
jgi:hypothetical protein